MHTVIFQKGTFGYDLEFLKGKDSVILLRNGDAKVIVSAKYQGKVFTSTADGDLGQSFGWVNYKALESDSILPHMNAYGGEDRLWLGPEGGQFSIFFKPGAPMTFDNWNTPPALDYEPWELVSKSEDMVSMQKSMQLLNYSGTTLHVSLKRKVKLLSEINAKHLLGINIDSRIKWVGFETENILQNIGTQPWTKQSGTICIWMLSMLNPSEKGIVAIPYIQNENTTDKPPVATSYFGEIPPDRIKIEGGIVYFRVDGKHRSKLGLGYKIATPYAASYDEKGKVLTIVQFSKPEKEADYINQLWEIQKEPFKGEVINSYNDGPLEDGSQMGPFYEVESSSPAALLAPGESLTHFHRVFHFVGDEAELDLIAKPVLGVTIQQIKSALPAALKVR